MRMKFENENGKKELYEGTIVTNSSVLDTIPQCIGSRMCLMHNTVSHILLSNALC